MKYLQEFKTFLENENRPSKIIRKFHPESGYKVIFEDDGTTGYFYVMDKNNKIVKSKHAYTMRNGTSNLGKLSVECRDNTCYLYVDNKQINSIQI